MVSSSAPSDSDGSDRTTPASPGERLSEALESLGRPVEVDDLNRRGLRRIHAVRRSELRALIEEEVQRALKCLAARREDGAADAEVRGDTSDLEERVEREVRRRLSQWKPSRDSHELGEYVHRERVEVLQRRLEKLKRELLEMEVTMDRLTRHNDLDPGLASIYRQVQSLNAQDPQYEKKKGLLAHIFESNRALQSSAAGHGTRADDS